VEFEICDSLRSPVLARRVGNACDYDANEWATRAPTSSRAAQLARRHGTPGLDSADIPPPSRANAIALALYLLASDISAPTIYALPT
jgi:hypothetical protein